MEKMTANEVFHRIIMASESRTFRRFPDRNYSDVVECTLSLTVELIDLLNQQEHLSVDVQIDNRAVYPNSIAMSFAGKPAVLQLGVDSLGRKLGVFSNASAYARKLLGETRGLSPYQEVYLVAENLFSANGTEQLPLVEHARSYLELIDFLRGIADYIDGSKLIFFNQVRLEIQTDVASIPWVGDDLRTIPGSYRDLIHAVSTPEHREHRISILKATLIQFLGHEEKSVRLEKMAANFDEIYHSYKASFEMYLENFSYGKLRAEVERDVSDLLKRLYEAVSAVRNHVLVIATSAIAVSQLQNQAVLRNTIILLSILLASILFQVILANQRDAIDEVETDVAHLKERLCSTGKEAMAEKFVSTFGNLGIRIDAQKDRLRLFSLILWGNFFISLILYCGLTFSRVIESFFTIARFLSGFYTG
mgnify:CR=1 FL=1